LLVGWRHVGLVLILFVKPLPRVLDMLLHCLKLWYLLFLEELLLTGWVLGVVLSILCRPGSWSGCWSLRRLCGSYSTCPWVEGGRHSGPGHETGRSKPGRLKRRAGGKCDGGSLRDRLLLLGCCCSGLLLRAGVADGWRRRVGRCWLGGRLGP
jgi:hypothetical protein